MDKLYIFDPAPPISVPVIESNKEYPINRIFCVGRNYAAHAAEMGVTPDKEEPFYFTKTPNSIVLTGQTISYPAGTENYHYEMELVVAIGKGIFNATSENALDSIFAYSSGLDMTRRDLQLRAREKSRPWDLGKDFEESAIISPLVPVAVCGHITAGCIELSVNGEIKQTSDIADMINNVEEVIIHLSKFYHLKPGDLIYTGTPAGVGAIVAGDVIKGHIDGVNEIDLTIGREMVPLR